VSETPVSSRYQQLEELATVAEARSRVPYGWSDAELYSREQIEAFRETICAFVDAVEAAKKP